jgi:hypothetical protein
MTSNITKLMNPHFEKHYSLTLCLLLIALQSVPAQDLQIKFTEFKDNKVVLHYDLRDSVMGRFYTIRLYSSKDNYLNPLEKVAGDVGLEVRPGIDRKIAWDARKELGVLFDGRVSLEIRGRMFIPFINTESINLYKVFKRKRKYNITWSGGTSQNILNFDLYNGDEKILSYPNLANVGTYILEFPTYVRTGKNYRFRISDTKNKEDVVYTQPFRIKRKIPLLVKVVPMVVAGAALYWVLNKEGTSADPTIGLLPPDPTIGLPPTPGGE